MPRLDFIFEVTDARDGDLDLLELDPLELDLELELEDERDPDPERLDPDPESLERDFLRFLLVLWWGREEEWSRELACPFTGLFLSNLSLYCSVLPARSFQP